MHMRLRSVLPAIVALAALAAACSDKPVPTQTPGLDPAVQAAVSVAQDVPDDGLGTDPQEFADQLRKIGNDNEVLIALKDADVPPADPSQADETDVVAFARADSGKARRKEPGFAPAGPAARSAVLNILSTQGIQPYYEGSAVPILAVRLPDDAVLPALTALLRHPNVD
jgi:hypothetical protein